jgi:hypothetical protein
MLLLECLPDETVARRLGCARRALQHLAGKSRICKRLAESESNIGLIDEDPNVVQPFYLRDLQLSWEEHEVRIYQDQERNHRVVVLRPRFEEWLIKTTEFAGMKMSDFGLSDRGNELHREINSRIRNLEKLLDELINQKNQRLIYLRDSLGLGL